MRRAALIPFIIIAAVVVGGLLYLYGGPAFHETYQAAPSVPSVFSGAQTLTVLSEGQNAAGVDQRVNYRVTNADQFAALWQMIYTDDGQQAPAVDFAKYEVLALFDGSHSTGGYGIRLASVKDADGARTVTVVHTEPGDSCVPPGGSTSPFVIVQVPLSSLPISRIEQTVTTQCE